MDLSVLLATRNRADLLGRTLDSFSRLETGQLRWEVVVVDNGSTDSTTHVIQSYKRRLPLRAVHEPQPGKNVALNRAIPLLTGATVVFTDDDVVARPTWLSALAAATRRWHADDVFGGRIVPMFPPGTPEWLRNHPRSDAAFARFTPDRREGPIPRAPFGPNYALRAHLLANRRFTPDMGPKGGGAILGGETELLMRIMREGYRVIFVPSAEVGHIVRDEQLSARWLLQRAHNLGRGKMRLAHIFSIPTPSRRAMYWQLLTNGLRYATVAPLGSRLMPQAIESGSLFHYWRGQLDEFRSIAREGRRHAAVAGRYPA